MSNKQLNERVLIECGRNKGGAGRADYRELQDELRAYRGCSLGELEDACDLQYGTRISRAQAKHVFNERGMSLDNLGPLHRFLTAHVGRPWLEVKNLLRERIVGRGDSVRHVMGHVSDYVEEHPVLDDDGVVYQAQWRGDNEPRAVYPGYFYVLDGVLHRVPHKRLGYQIYWRGGKRYLEVFAGSVYWQPGPPVYRYGAWARGTYMSSRLEPGLYVEVTQIASVSRRDVSLVPVSEYTYTELLHKYTEFVPI